jgi:hypothetical protein
MPRRQVIGLVQGMVILAGSLIVLAFVCGYLAGAAWGAVAPSSGWQISSVAAPSTFSTGDDAQCVVEAKTQFILSCDEYEVTATNVGKLSTSGELAFSDVVPAGLEIQEARLFWSGSEENLAPENCATVGQLITCGLSEEPNGAHVPISLAPDATLRLVIFVKVESGARFTEACPMGLTASAGCVDNEATIEGGGAPVAAVTAEPLSRANVVNGPDPGFGFSSFGFEVFGANGAVDSVAGDHPTGLLTTVYMNTKFREGPGNEFEAANVQDTRDVVVALPMGLVGSVLATPRCTFSQLSSHVKEGFGGCPKDTIVGHLRTEPSANAAIDGPIYNMVPERGEPAEFAFVDLIAGTHVVYSHVVPTPGGYVLEAVSQEIPQTPVRVIQVEFYGVPEESDEAPDQKIPFFTNPTVCTGEEQTASIYMDSWQNPAKMNAEGMPVNLEEPQWVKAESKAPPVTGCNALQFSAEAQAQPSTREADAPTGLEYELSVPQPEKVGVPGTPTVKSIVTTLPEGLTGNPASAGGLQACSEAQIGWEEGAPGPMKFNAAAPECPEASKVGSLLLESPLTSGKLEGEVFLAAQNANPFKSTFALYVVVHDPVTGVLVKIAGELQADGSTGRLTAVFDENPDFPFSNLKLHFFSGPRAQLATPEQCGTFTITSALTPYSLEGTEPLTSVFAGFPVNEACTTGFSPTFNAGSEGLQAGAYTPFVASLERSDAEQEFAGLSVTLPPGVLAKLAGVGECTEEEIHEAEAGTGGCPVSSLLGSVSTGAGAGPDPFFVSGKAYLTGPYNGGSYGLAVVVPAVAGPYNFGTVVVRQSLRINPRTALVTDVSDPFPKILDGIPLRDRRVELAIERPEFTFNPTSCNKLQLTGIVTGSPLEAATRLNGNIGYAAVADASSAFTTPFQVTGCKTLKFTPSVAVQTKGKASKANGQSLQFKISYPKNALGSQSWLEETKFDIPKQLPSRLETIQQACTEQTFETNRTACPPASIIGHAIVHTPVLPEPLEGPLYFVSDSNQKFPEGVLVLKGDNVLIEEHGETFIDHKTGITSATFRNIPDAPIESIEVTLPTGPFSEFGSNLPKNSYNFCGRKLTMPTLFKAQNGLEIHQSTPITITGCPKPKHKAKTKAKHHAIKKR